MADQFAHSKRVAFTVNRNSLPVEFDAVSLAGETDRLVSFDAELSHWEGDISVYVIASGPHRGRTVTVRISYPTTTF